ncbi:MAG: hypothetical protein ABI570_07140 [Ilumatobacteraceae bacterium]
MSNSDLSSLSLVQLRQQRNELQAQEDAVSFARRMAQGRLDIANDEVRRRTDNTPISQSVTTNLAGIFGQEHGGGSARPPRETNVSPDHALVRELERLCEDIGFASLRTLDDESLNQMVESLQVFESQRSAERRQLFDKIDELTVELVRRYKDGGADIDSIMND